MIFFYQYDEDFAGRDLRIASSTFKVEMLINNELLEHIHLRAPQTPLALVHNLQCDAVRWSLQVAMFCQVLQDLSFGHSFEDFVTIHVFFSFGDSSPNPPSYTATRKTPAAASCSRR
jgi:hypothetical protein